MISQIEQQIDQHYKNLTDALSVDSSSQGWTHIQTLDSEFRRSLQDLISRNQMTDIEQASLALSVKKLQILYQQVIAKCGEFQSELKQEINTVTRGRKGVKAYQVVA